MIILFLDFGVYQRIILKGAETVNIDRSAMTADLFVPKKEIYIPREGFVHIIHTKVFGENYNCIILGGGGGYEAGSN